MILSGRTAPWKCPLHGDCADESEGGAARWGDPGGAGGAVHPRGGGPSARAEGAADPARGPPGEGGGRGGAGAPQPRPPLGPRPRAGADRPDRGARSDALLRLQRLSPRPDAGRRARPGGLARVAPALAPRPGTRPSASAAPYGAAG